jgi:long-subunit acyl-CoA synthetase (AMP-forming)
VALLAETRPEWTVYDLAVVLAQGANVFTGYHNNARPPMRIAGRLAAYR